MTAIGLVAHDEKKAAMVAWVTAHRNILGSFRIFSTGTTGGRIREACPELDVTPLKSGPLGGDQQLGAMIAEGRLSALVFFIDPLSPHPHDVDIKALIRIAALNDIPLAVNKASADLVLAGLKA
ncbi:methylglyoxal synthase [Gimibacter soli]|uniref:Methylglyoxal synthase n=1 Tax=Gimibacter soli TaxID=3024400 RepID=A0AAE9XQW0_9PROT|nr:methylglyoxal synthase [Gimibacter soli]WCL54686.1 methylglyoxal synthase [Gimibacter soli]